jgi:hypothetical protein
VFLTSFQYLKVTNIVYDATQDTHIQCVLYYVILAENTVILYPVTSEHNLFYVVSAHAATYIPCAT